MDFRKLDAFCKVYELQNFSKAGDVMFLSQPTISSHIANLEEELGVKLFDRIGRKILPTQAGEVLYQSALSIFDDLREARASIELLRDKVIGELTVGCSTIPAQFLLPELLSPFTSRFPDVTFTVQTSDSLDVIKKVSSGKLPIGIVGHKSDDTGIVSELLVHDATVVVAAPHCPWRDVINKPLSLKELIHLPWIMRKRGSATRNILKKSLLSAGYNLNSLNVRCQVDGTSEMLAHIMASVGIGVTTEIASKKFINSGQLIPLQVPALQNQRSFYLIYHKERHMFPAMHSFVNFARHYFSDPS